MGREGGGSFFTWREKQKGNHERRRRKQNGAARRALAAPTWPAHVCALGSRQLKLLSPQVM